MNFEDLDPKILEKVKNLIKQYIIDYNNCIDLEEYYILFCSNIIFSEFIKNHYDEVHSINEYENCRLYIEDSCSSAAIKFIESFNKKIFEN